MERIKLSELLIVCADFLKNPTEQESAKVLDVTSKFVIREFLPLMDKQVAMVNILYRVLEQDKDAVAIQCNIEIAKVVCGLLKYVINLDNDLGEEPLLNAAVYDTLFQSGVVDEILAVCEDDYARLEKMIEGATNFSNIFKMEKVAALMTPETLQAFTDAVKDLELTISSDKVAQLAKIYESRDENAQLFGEIVRQAAVGKALGPKAEINPVNPDDITEEAPAEEQKKKEEDA